MPNEQPTDANAVEPNANTADAVTAAAGQHEAPEGVQEQDMPVLTEAAPQGNIATAVINHLNVTRLWDKLTLKPSHNPDGSENGKVYLSSGQVTLQNVPIKYHGKDVVSTRVQITIIARNIQEPKAAMARRKTGRVNAAITTLERQLESGDLDEATEKRAAELLAKLQS